MQKLLRTVFILGGPGSGKGTQCSFIEKQFHYKHLSAGELLRRELQQNTTEEAKLIDAAIKDGKIVPSDITVRLLKREMLAYSVASSKNTHFKVNGFLIDGFPRNPENLAGWQRGMATTASIQFVLHLVCHKDELEHRLLARGVTSGRSDDNRESIKKRMVVYEKQTLEVVKSFAANGHVIQIDASRPVGEVKSKIEAIFMVRSEFL